MINIKINSITNINTISLIIKLITRGLNSRIGDKFYCLENASWFVIVVCLWNRAGINPSVDLRSNT
jgi:hypothetical protein